MEHDMGVYDVDQYTHEAELSMPVAGGDAAVMLSYENDGILYNASYARDVGSGATAIVGVDNDGVYSKLTAARGVADGLDAAYEAQARANFDSDDNTAEMSHALKLSHKLGHMLLTHGTNEKP